MKRIISLILILAFIVSISLSGCGNNQSTQTTDRSTASQAVQTETTAAPTEAQKSQFPITKDKITLKFIRISHQDVRPPCGDIWMWKKYEEMTNMHIEWEEIPQASLEEKKSVIISSGDLPDAFYQFIFTPEEIASYGSQGIFIPMEDIIQKDTIGLKTLFKEHPDVCKTITMADGHIYSLPYVNFNVETNSMRYYFREDWLKQLNMAVPATLDEFVNVLKAFRDNDMNGNGEKDEIPYHIIWGSVQQFFEVQLMGSYGLGNRGNGGTNDWIDMGPDGKLRFIPKDPKFKELWQFVANMYKEKLMYQDIFTDTDYTKLLAAASNDQIGAFSFINSSIVGSEVGKKYIGTTVLKGPYGDRLTWSGSPVIGIFGLMITNKNKYPTETMKWVDYYYTDEGRKFGYLGLEGETYTMKDGKPVYTDEILNYKGGPDLGAFQYVEMTYGGHYPYIDLPLQVQQEAKNLTVFDAVSAPDNEFQQYLLDEIWPQFTSTVDEANELKPILTDMNNYIKEMHVKFITGKADFDKDWDGFMAKLDQIGAKRYLEIKQQQYERFSK